MIRVHEVNPGDTIVRIAQMYDVPTCHVLSGDGKLLDPYRLFRGQQIFIHPRSAERYTTHHVVPGETVERIAQQHKISLSQLKGLNAGIDWSRLYQGQSIALPDEHQIEDRKNKIYDDILNIIDSCRDDKSCLKSQLPEIHERFDSI